MGRLTIVVATDARGGIGINNTLPWRLPEDLAYFKRVTTGRPIIMGRKTFDSIGRPLPNRRNIVITRDMGWSHEGVQVVHSVAEAVAAAGPEDACIIGGAQIFAETLDAVDTLLVTEIDKTFDCDVFFPLVDKSVWKETAREAYHSDANGFGYAFVTYQRSAAAA